MLKRMDKDKKVVNMIDCPMGSGKTSAAIRYINELEGDERVIFVSPYNKEGERVRDSCRPGWVTYLEDSEGSRKRGKLTDLKYALMRNENVASTHALLSRYEDTTLALLENANYTLIIDETHEVIRGSTKKQRLLMEHLININAVSIDERGVVSFTEDANIESLVVICGELIKYIKNGAIVYQDGGNMLVWLFPPKILTSFKRVVVMSYQMEYQSLYPYLLSQGFEIHKMGCKSVGDGYAFCEAGESEGFRYNPAEKIHIIQREKLNRIGNGKTALSASWYTREAKEGGELEQLGRNIRNVKKNAFKTTADNFMWTSYKGYQDFIADRNIKNCFVSCNAKASNDYRNIHYLAYAINLYQHPSVYNYFRSIGYDMDLDGWALSSMLQWIWRSAIRDGEDIYIYIPSNRMRGLLEEWLKEVDSEWRSSGARR